MSSLPFLRKPIYLKKQSFKQNRVKASDRKDNPSPATKKRIHHDDASSFCFIHLTHPLLTSIHFTPLSLHRPFLPFRNTP